MRYSLLHSSSERIRCFGGAPPSSGPKCEPSTKPAQAGAKHSDQQVENSAWYRPLQAWKGCDRPTERVNNLYRGTQRALLREPVEEWLLPVRGLRAVFEPMEEWVRWLAWSCLRTSESDHHIMLLTLVTSIGSLSAPFRLVSGRIFYGRLAQLGACFCLVLALLTHGPWRWRQLPS